MPKKKSSSKNKIAKLTIDNVTYDLPIYDSTEGESVIDISKLHSKANVFTYDPGFTSTASCESKITFIDGSNGILRYRGYDIEELASKSDFIEVVNLLIYGDLPNKEQLNKYKRLIGVSCPYGVLWIDNKGSTRGQGSIIKVKCSEEKKVDERLK